MNFPNAGGSKTIDLGECTLDDPHGIWNLCVQGGWSGDAKVSGYFGHLGAAGVFAEGEKKKMGFSPKAKKIAVQGGWSGDAKVSGPWGSLIQGVYRSMV